ncbi:MAG: class II glutamine amidotransferase [Methanomassiliicoccales archaeon]
MFVAAGTGLFINSLGSALRRAAQHDVFSKGKSHGDGWGYAAVSDAHEICSRSIKPIYEDVLPNFGSELLGCLFHARLAAKGEPRRSCLNSHPFTAHLPEGVLYLTHNGQVDRQKVAAKFGVAQNGRTDSEIMTLALEKIEGTYEERFANVMEYCGREAKIGSVIVMALLHMYTGGFVLLLNVDPEADGSYHRIYELTDDENNFAWMSSSIAFELKKIDIQGREQDSSIRKMTPGQIYKRHFSETWKESAMPEQ